MCQAASSSRVRRRGRSIRSFAPAGTQPAIDGIILLSSDSTFAASRRRAALAFPLPLFQLFSVSGSTALTIATTPRQCLPARQAPRSAATTAAGSPPGSCGYQGGRAPGGGDAGSESRRAWSRARTSAARIPAVSYWGIQPPCLWPHRSKQGGKRASAPRTSRASSGDPGSVRSHLPTSAGSRPIRHCETRGVISWASSPIARGGAGRAAPQTGAASAARPAASPARAARRRESDGIGFVGSRWVAGSYPPEARPGKAFRRRRHVRFTAERREIYLTHFVETGDRVAAAAQAGVSPSTVDWHRRNDPAFAEACRQASAECLVRHEAEAVRLRLAAQARLRSVVEAAADAPHRPLLADEDAEFDRIMKLLDRFDRKPNRPATRFQPGSRHAPWSFERAIAALDKALDALGERTPFPPELKGEGDGEGDGEG